MTTPSCSAYPLPHARLDPGFCAVELPVEVSEARTILALEGVASSLLVLERGTSSVSHLQDLQGNDSIPDTKRVLLQQSGLNHGLAVYDNYIYASSDTTVYRWPFNHSSSNNQQLFDTIGDPTVVIANINANGNGGAPQGHTTRTIVFDTYGRLYISVGSMGNVDPNSYRARIRRFNISNTTHYPIDFETGEVYADGLRNEVGLAFDKHGVLWGVENGADKLYRQDLGGDIHNDNPAEELNRFPEETIGARYGYPFCWTEYKLPDEFGKGRGTVWAWPSSDLTNETYTDEQCNSSLFTKPEVAMQGHSAPLGITFYHYQNASDLPANCSGCFPESMDGYAFIAFHGSWNRDPPTGYKVVYVPMDANGRASGSPVDLLAHDSDMAPWPDGFRPVDVDFDACGRLLVSSDGSQGGNGTKIVRIERLPGDDFPTATPTVQPPFDASPTPSSAADPRFGGALWPLFLLLACVVRRAVAT